MTDELLCLYRKNAREGFPPERLKALLTKVTVADNGCWLWGGYVDPAGYGRLSIFGRNSPVHRIAWLAFRGDVPGNMQVHHKCRSHSCLNPDHLECLLMEDHTLRHIGSRTHCSRGHELTPENTYTYEGRQKIRCRKCHSEWAASRRAAMPVVPKGPRTHCRYGHEFTPENAYEFRGKRQCKKCHAELTLRQYHAAKPALEMRPPVIHAPKTHCKHGHEMTPENTYVNTDRNGVIRRSCKQCQLASFRRRYVAHPKPKSQSDVCVRGHAWTPENTYLDPAGRKFCRACRIIRSQSESRTHQAAQ